MLENGEGGKGRGSMEISSTLSVVQVSHPHMESSARRKAEPCWVVDTRGATSEREFYDSPSRT